MTKRIYTVYKGDEIIANGTLEQCARALGVKRSTVQWYATPSARKKSGTVAVCTIDREG